MRRSIVLLLLTLCCLNVFSQDSSTNPVVDTSIRTPIVIKPRIQKPRILRRDTLTAADSIAISDSIRRVDSLVALTSVTRPAITLFRRQRDTALLELSPFFRFTNPMRYSITIKKWLGKEAIFYSIIALLIFFALIKNGFGRYVADLFKTYFRMGINQKQAKEQLLQHPLPSVLLNVFFVLSIGMFVALLLQYFKLGLDFNFWWLYLYCSLGLIAIYLMKYVSLKFLGWIFQVSESTDAYIFIVFATNKIIGIALLPFLVMLAFTYGVVNEAAMSLSIMVVVGLLVYRFFLSYVSIRRQIRVGFLHFLLYLIAFEVVPLLLINKVLFSFLGETY
ncbi:MAG: DUF4271 domain-containing protein [Flavisolibacter sp.]